MIVGIGTDIVRIARLREVLERHPRAFAQRAFTAGERAAAGERAVARECFYAGRWAAKEALAKALGCGIGAACGWQDIETLNDAGGRPVLRLRGAAAATARQLGAEHIHLSLSHEQEYAIAFVVLERGTGRSQGDAP